MLRSSYYPKLDLLKQKRRGTYVTYDFFVGCIFLC